jgi:hypothetical protein
VINCSSRTLAWGDRRTLARWLIVIVVVAVTLVLRRAGVGVETLVSIGLAGAAVDLVTVRARRRWIVVAAAYGDAR